MRSFAILLALTATLSSVLARPYISGEERALLRQRRRQRVRRAGPSNVSNVGFPQVVARNVQCPASTAKQGGIQETAIGGSGGEQFPGVTGVYLYCLYNDGTTCLYMAGDNTAFSSQSSSDCGQAVDQPIGGVVTYTICPAVFNGMTGSYQAGASGVNIETSSGETVTTTCAYQPAGSAETYCSYDPTSGAIQNSFSGVINGVLTPAQAIAAGCAPSAIQATDPSQQLSLYSDK